MNPYSHLNFVTPPKNQGQIVTHSYAIDSEREEVVCRTHDASDQTTCYQVTGLDNLLGEFSPWNREPAFVDDGLWSAIDER
jgi:hypothetical protein